MCSLPHPEPLGSSFSFTDAYTMVSASFGVRWANGKVTTSVKGTNLLNQTIQQHVFGDILKRSLTPTFGRPLAPRPVVLDPDWTQAGPNLMVLCPQAIDRWWALKDSNLRLPPCEGGTLPLS